MGVSCVNALSKMLRLTVRRDGRVHFMEFKRGVPQDRVIEQREGFDVSPMRVTGDTENRGTEVHFLPDDEIFENIDFHYELVGKFDGECAAVAAWRKALREAVARKPASEEGEPPPDEPR